MHEMHRHTLRGSSQNVFALQDERIGVVVADPDFKQISQNKQRIRFGLRHVPSPSLEGLGLIGI